MSGLQYGGRSSSERAGDLSFANLCAAVVVVVVEAESINELRKVFGAPVESAECFAAERLTFERPPARSKSVASFAIGWLHNRNHPIQSDT